MISSRSQLSDGHRFVRWWGNPLISLEVVSSYLRSRWGGAKSTFCTVLHCCDLSTCGHWPMVMALCIIMIMKLIFWLFVWLRCLFQLLFNFIVNAGEAEEETWLRKTFWDFLPGWLRIPQAFSVPFSEYDYQIKSNASARSYCKCKHHIFCV